MDGRSTSKIAGHERPALIPTGSWPLEMRAETAAAYCDEPSVEAFLAKVQRNIYPAPMRQKGCLPKWHRLKLEHDIARRHGSGFDRVVHHRRRHGFDLIISVIGWRKFVKQPASISM